MANSDRSQTRLLSLDALRGLAALAVVLFHYMGHFQEKYGHVSPPLFSFELGRYGVELFFMISGFVIFLTLDRVRSTADFAFARFSRLFPTYWAAVLLTWTIVSLFGLPGREVSAFAAVANMTMIQAVLGFPHVDGVYWTLQAELGFYLLAGLIFWSGQRQRGVIILALLVVADCFVAYFDLRKTVAGLWRVYSLFPLDNLYLFLFGAAIYELTHARISYRTATVIGVIAIIATAIVPRPMHLPIVLSLAALLWAACAGDFRFLRGKWLYAVGTISYPLYLLHDNIGYVMLIHLERIGVPVYLAIGLAIIAALSLAAFVSHFVEYPAMHRLRTWWKKRKGSLGATHNA
jgi:peptidoglycan/LPS O-acetylase OafA/YrhL